MKRFTIGIDIAAAPERVWQVMSDVERWHEWTPSITNITRLDGTGPLAPGSRAIVRQPKFPPASWKVSEVRPGESFTWANTAPGVRVVGYHAVTPIPGGSRATLTVDYGGPIGALMARLLAGITERYIRFEAHGLKLRSENPSYRVA
jgi:uncharacterized protein YndB with AHSA1/START domain